MVKLPPSLATRTRGPIIPVPPVAPKMHSASQRAAPPLSRTSASPCGVRTRNRGPLHSIDAPQDSAFHLPASRGGLLSLPAQLLTRMLYIVGKQDVRRKLARSQEN